MRNGMNFSEAGRLGAIASKEGHRLAKLNRVEAYNKTPILCHFCQKPLPYEKRHDRFCNQSCAASYNNTGIRRVGSDKNCLYCSDIVKKNASKFCSNKCQQEYQYREYIRSWLLGQESGSGKWERVSFYIRRWLKEKNGVKCSICGMVLWMGKEIPLIIDHIDGNHRNNDQNNLRLICGNCDMQLPTYKGGNRGNGRFYRRLRYSEGKSY